MGVAGRGLRQPQVGSPDGQRQNAKNCQAEGGSGGREDGVEGVFASHHEVQVGLGQVAEAAVKDDGQRDVVERGVVGRGVTGAEATGVLAEACVAPVVVGVLDHPVAAVPGEQLLGGHVLRALASIGLTTFRQFEAALTLPGPWIAGIDLPFGQARRFIADMSWPPNWEGYVRHAESLGKARFEAALRKYSDDQPPGQKLHLRRTDKRARSLSPQKLDFTPVGKNFFEGAPRILRSDVTIPHQRVVCGRGRNPTLSVFASNVDRSPATGILRSG